MPNTYKGGNAPGYATSSKPSLGFSVSAPMKAAHGHFAQEKFLRAGHNVTPRPSTPFPAPGTGGRKSMVDRIGGRIARRILTGKSGGAYKATAADVRAERPVLTAKVDRRAAVKAARSSGVAGAVKAARQAGRQALAVARTSSNTAANERRMRRQAQRATPVVPRDQAGRPTY